MRTIILALTLILSVANAQNPSMTEISAKHDKYWTQKLGADYPATDIGIIITKYPPTLYVVRNDGVADTLDWFGVCAMNSTAGPKAHEGDGMTPDGVYYIDMMNPNSHFHLSMRINYPNAADLVRHKWIRKSTHFRSDSRGPGGNIFIHGACVTAGCVALYNDDIERLYLLISKAQKRGQKRVPVLITPCSDASDYNSLVVNTGELARDTKQVFWRMVQDHIMAMHELATWYTTHGRIPDPGHDSRGVYVQSEFTHR